ADGGDRAARALRQSRLLSWDERSAVNLILQRSSGAERHAAHRILGEVNRKAGRILQHGRKVPEKRSAAGHGDALVDHVGGDLGLRMLKGGADHLDDLVDRLAERGGDLGLIKLDLAGHSAPDITTPHQGGKTLAVLRSDGRANLEFDTLGGAFPDQKVEVASYIG